MARFISQGTSTTAVADIVANRAPVVFPGIPGKQLVIKNIAFRGAHVADTIYFWTAQPLLKTTVKTAAADEAVTLVLDSDANKYINGYDIADTDYLLVQTSAETGIANDAGWVGHEWRLVAATSTAITGDTTATVTGLVAGRSSTTGIGVLHTGIEGAVAVGATVYVIPVASLQKLVMSSNPAATLDEVGTINLSGDLFAAYDQGLPCGILLAAGTTTAVSAVITAEYVDDVANRPGRLA